MEPFHILEKIEQRVEELFDWIRDGQIQIKDPVEFSLSEGQIAHEFM